MHALHERKKERKQAKKKQASDGWLILVDLAKDNDCLLLHIDLMHQHFILDRNNED